MGELVAQLPGAQLGGAGVAHGLHDPVFRFAEQVEAALEQQVQGEGKAGQAIGQDAVMNVSAGGKVAGQGRRLLPHLASAARVAVVAVAERLVGDEPEALDEKGRKQARRYALRQIEMESAKAGERVGHHNRNVSTSLNGGCGAR